MEKISFYGLSRSGKSCYIFAMAQALSQGIKFPNGEILTIRTPDPRQMLRLYKAYEQMMNGQWPAGNIESAIYKFNTKKSLVNIMSFELSDYRGGLLDTMDDDDKEAQEELLSSYKDSSVLLFFIGADIVKKALAGDFESNFKINYLNVLYDNYLEQTYDSKTPVMIVITKSDMLSPQEVVKVKEFVMTKMQSLFAYGTNITAAITAVTLGKNLSNDNGELEGELIIGPTSGNIHIPVLYSLYCVLSKELEEAHQNLVSAQDAYNSSRKDLSHELNRSSFARFWVNNESDIRGRMGSYSSSIGEEKEKISQILQTMELIKPYIIKGADLYINGNLVQ